MTISKIVHYTEIVSAIAVVLSLIFVGLEIRQSNYLAQYDSVTKLNDAFNELNRMVIENFALSDLILRAEEDYKDLSEVEFNVLTHWSISWFNVYESAWTAHDRGVLDLQSLETYTASACMVIPTAPYMLAAWERNKPAFSVDFVEHIESECEISDQ